MSKKLENVIFGIVAIAFIAGMGWLIHYKFADCRKVGHEVLYCIMDLS